MYQNPKIILSIGERHLIEPVGNKGSRSNPTPLRQARNFFTTLF